MSGLALRALTQETMNTVIDLALTEEPGAFTSFGTYLDCFRTDLNLWQQGYRDIPGFSKKTLLDITPPLCSIFVAAVCIHLHAEAEFEYIRTNPLFRSTIPSGGKVQPGVMGRLTLENINDLNRAGSWNKMADANKKASLVSTASNIRILESAIHSLVNLCDALGYKRDFSSAPTAGDPYRERLRVLERTVQDSEYLALSYIPLLHLAVLNLIDPNTEVRSFVSRKKQFILTNW